MNSSSTSNTSFFDLTDCTFIMKDTNISHGISQKGGAMRIKKTSTKNLTSTILNCRFINNTAMGSGGAIYMEGSGIHLNILSSSFLNNTVKEKVSNLYQLTLDSTKEVLVVVDIIGNLTNFITFNNNLLGTNTLNITAINTSLSL